MKNLKNLSKELRRLRLTDTSFEQEFLNSLPSITDQLEDLVINESSNSPLNFNFISNLKALNRFKTNRAVERPMELAVKMIEQSFEAHEILFEFKDSPNEVTVIRGHPKHNDFSLYFLDDTTLKTLFSNPQLRLSLPELVELYEQKKGGKSICSDSFGSK